MPTTLKVIRALRLQKNLQKIREAHFCVLPQNISFLQKENQMRATSLYLITVPITVNKGDDKRTYVCEFETQDVHCTPVEKQVLAQVVRQRIQAMYLYSQCERQQ